MNREAWDTVSEEVQKILGEGAIRIDGDSISREVKRAMARMDTELNADWKRGKSIQRKQNLGFAPIAWRDILGLDIDQTPPNAPFELVTPITRGYRKFARLVAQEAVMTLVGPEEKQQAAGFQTSVIIAAVHTALYPIWTYMRAQQFGEPNVFSVRDSLIEKLLNTDIGDVLPSDVRLPFPGTYVSLPFGEQVFFLRNQHTGLHEASFVGIGEGSIRGERTLFCTFWGEPRADGQRTSDDHIYSLAFGLPDDAGSSTLKALLSRSDVEERATLAEEGIPLLIEHDMVRVYGQSFDFFDAVNLLRRFVVNFCLYLNSPNPDIQPTRGGQSAWDVVAGEPRRSRTKVRVSKKRRQSKRKQKVKAAPYAVWEVGRNVEKLRRVSSATDILVRGHFRRQAHGPGRTLRRVIWIEPHIRLPSDGGDAPGHEYDVTSNA